MPAGRFVQTNDGSATSSARDPQDDGLSELKPPSPTLTGAESVEFKTVPAVCTAECFAGLVLIEFLYLEESPLSLLKKSCEMCRVAHRFPKAERVGPDKYVH